MSLSLWIRAAQSAPHEAFELPRCMYCGRQSCMHAELWKSRAWSSESAPSYTVPTDERRARREEERLPMY